jgi:ABC-type antimicrobial peptide transport system permease subunit
LGSTGAKVAALVIRQGLRLVAIGAGIGLVLAAGAGQILAGVLQGVQPWDPAVIASVLALLLVVALAAVAVPARRAAGVDPVEALRSD